MLMNQHTILNTRTRPPPKKVKEGVPLDKKGNISLVHKTELTVDGKKFLVVSFMCVLKNKIKIKL